MAAWIRPVEYDVAADRGIIMNKESSYEFGLEDNTGALQGAFSPCWRWWGTRLVPMHEWTHVAVGYDGASEVHFVNSEIVESVSCGGGGDLTPSADPLRIGHRTAFVGAGLSHSNFVGDIDEAMVYNKVLGEADLGKIYVAQYRSEAVADSVTMHHSHSLGVQASGASANKKVAKGASRKALGKLDDLVGFWPLNGDAEDGSGNGHDGSMQGSAELATGEYAIK